MTHTLAGLFRSLFPAICSALALIVLGGAGLYYLATGFAFSAIVMALGGLAALVALFGLVALQIENNDLLHRIAEAAEGQAAGAMVRPVGGQGAPTLPAVPDEAEDLGPTLVARRIIATPRRAQPAAAVGRIEPVVTVQRRAGA